MRSTRNPQNERRHVTLHAAHTGAASTPCHLCAQPFGGARAFACALLSQSLSAGLFIFLFAGCSTLPPEPLRQPPPPDSAMLVVTNALPERPLPQDWWTAFRDPELDRLVILALAENRDLQKAGARLEAAQARARLAGAEAALQVTGSASASRLRTSGNTAAASGPDYQTRLNAGLQFAYEADLWGRIGAMRESALKNVELSVADQAAAAIAIAAEVAKAHMSRLAVCRELVVLERQIAAFAETVSLLTARSDAGFATDLDVERVRIEKAARELDAARLRERGQALANALSLLCGQAAANTAASANLPLADAVTPEIPASLSLALLECRPDVAAKRAKWEASFQRVEAARADFHPTLRLSGTFGTEGQSADDLLDWQSHLWSLVAGLTGPLLDGGRLQANLALERAGLREAAADYEAAVLTAYREVADALNALSGITDQQQSAELLRMAASRALALSRERYDKGFVTYLEVIESDRVHLAAERTLVQLQASRQTATVDLIRALGIP